MKKVNNFIPVCEPHLNGNELKYVKECIETGWISSSGVYIKKFEESFANYCGAKYAVCVTNGTVALHLALLAIGVKKGDEVIIPNFTMIASAFAVCYIGAIPVFVDADISTWNINVDLIESKITSKTKAIMPVSIFGQPCNMTKINNLAKNYNLKVIEDAAESHGAEYNGKKTGTLADVTTFSFFANKNLTTGEGGMVVTNNEEYYNKCLYYKNLCFPLNGPRNYIHEDIGFNYRMSNIHAAIGLAQVEKADYYRDKRISIYQMYKKFLANTPGIIFQDTIANCFNVHWMNAILIDSSVFGIDRDELIKVLNKYNIDSRLLFVGMNKQPALKKYGCDTSFAYPVTDHLTQNGLYLPSGSSLTENQIKYISEVIINAKQIINES